jgi:hypothetical protein
MLPGFDLPLRRLCLVTALTLAGCAAVRPQPPAALVTASAPQVPAKASSEPALLAVSPPRARDAIGQVLAYADQVRAMQGLELAQEVARLTEGTTPDDQLRLAIALSQNRQSYDPVRAQDLLQRILANSGNEARPLHPLARLLAARLTDQKRLEDQLDRQGQQLREVQRRLDQTNEKLEALREIERSLTSRPGASVPAPPYSRGRGRPATP